MIMISSEAGQRLAKAKVDMDADAARFEQDSFNHVISYAEAQSEFVAAAKALADELIAENHHTGEGD